MTETRLFASATASMLDHLLIMAGINALTGRPVRELRTDLEAWLAGA